MALPAHVLIGAARRILAVGTGALPAARSPARAAGTRAALPAGTSVAAGVCHGKWVKRIQTEHALPALHLVVALAVHVGVVVGLRLLRGTAVVALLRAAAGILTVAVARLAVRALTLVLVCHTESGVSK